MDKAPKSTELTALDADGEVRASFTIGTDVIDYLEPARTFGREDLADPAAPGRYQARMIALPDRRGQPVEPMVLTLGTGQRLALVRRTPDASAGWESIEVAQDVMAFGAAWAEIDGKEHVTVAVAVNDSKADKAVSRLLVAYDLDASQADWNSLPWTDYGTRGDMAIDAIRLHREQDQHWTTVLSASAGGKQDVWLVRDEHRSLQQALAFTVPSELKETLALDLGAVGDDTSLFALGVQHSRAALALFTRRMPFEGGQMSTTGIRSFACPPHAQVLSLGAPGPDGNDLYIGGAGVHLLGKDEFIVQDPRFEQVIAPEQARSIRQLSVCENAEGATSVWALQADGQLLMTYREAAGQDWNQALMVRSDVADLAPVMGDDHLTAGVLLVYRDGHAGHLWRDADGVWQESEIRVADPHGAASTTCFATNIVISDADGLGQLFTQVTLRASVLSTLVVNGKSVTTGPDTPVQVETDAQGALRIFNRALSFAPALYRIDIAACGQTLEVNPAATLHARFNKLSVKELQAAKTGDTPLLEDEYRGAEGTRTLETLVSALKQASVLMDNVGGPARLVPLGTAFDTHIGRHLSDDYAWGVASDGDGGLSTTAESQALAVKGSDDVVLAGLGESLSDLLEGLWSHAGSALKSVVGFVVRKVGEVVEFVCEIAGKVKRFVLDTLEKIGGFFKWLWAQVKTGAQKAWNFVKFLFDWGDIKIVRQHMIDSIESQFDEMLEVTGRMQDRIDKGFNQVRDMLSAKARELGITYKGQPVPGKAQNSLVRGQPKGERNQYEVTRSGPGAWVNDLISGLVSNFVVYEEPDVGDSHREFERTINGHLEELKSAFEDIGVDTRHVFGPEGFKLAELDFDKIQKLVVSLLFNIADVAVRVAKAVVIGMLTSLRALIGAFRLLMFSTIRFPFMEKAIAMVTGAKVDTSFRIIDVVMWPAAVLTTLTCKLALDEASMKLILTSKAPKQGALTAQSGILSRVFNLLREIAGNVLGIVKALMKAGLLFAGVVPKEAMKGYKKVLWAAGLAYKVTNPFLPFGRVFGFFTEVFLFLFWLTGMTQLAVQFCGNLSLKVLGGGANVLAQVETAYAEAALIAISALFWTLSYWADDDKTRNPWKLTNQLAGATSGILMQACIVTKNPKLRGVLYVTGFGVISWVSWVYIGERVKNFRNTLEA
ncbi:hypothetical protein NS274_08795 [Pseudomonas oryzihabitans]|nr:hypothetical protein NS274_08795 [Pseudomonas psychrotolerans]